MNDLQNILVMGLGYIGLPTAVTLALHNKKVIGVDINDYVVDSVNNGNAHIYEPWLLSQVKSVVNSKLLIAQKVPASADFFLITVPTPCQDDKTPDMSFVEAAVEAIAPYLRQGNVIIIESTCPVGSTEYVSKQLANLRKDLKFPHEYEMPDIFIAYCPERVLPGKIFEELVKNDRLIGGLTLECAQKARELYQVFVKGDCIITDARTAEMCKLVENSFRDVNIAFANELSIICDAMGLDVWKLIDLANKHPRVNILQPGCGVGGHCIPIDPWFIVAQNSENAKLIKMARQVNDKKPLWVVNKVIETLKEISQLIGKNIKDLQIACFGVTFKSDVDDLRESPALCVVRSLIQSGYNVIVTDPCLPISTEFKLVEVDNAINEADLMLILVGHEKFRNLKFKNKPVLDICGIYKKF